MAKLSFQGVAARQRKLFQHIWAKKTTFMYTWSPLPAFPFVFCSRHMSSLFPRKTLCRVAINLSGVVSSLSHGRLMQLLEKT